MRTLEFVVDQQRARKSPYCSFSGLVAGSVGYLRAKFKFSEEWTGLKKAASFWVGDEEYGALLDSDDSCDIPEEVTKHECFEVSVTGMDNNGKYIPTTKTKVVQEVQ